MLEDYKIEQPIAYKILNNAIVAEKISHAYIFETNGYKNKDLFLMTFVKSVLCPNKGKKDGMRCDCNICTQIDNNEFLELKIIDVDGNVIKKNEMDELQREFSNKPIIGNKKVYVIHNADRMNSYSSNSILKFLEEPEEGIIAILVVDNIYQLLETIISRCQIIKLNGYSNYDSIRNEKFLNKLAQILNYNTEEYQKFINDDSSYKKIEQVMAFINNIETNMGDAFISEVTKLSGLLSNSLGVQFILIVMLVFYKDVINYKLNLQLEIFNNEFLENIKKTSSSNNLPRLCKKINILLKLRMEYKVNANTNLLIDRLIMEFSEV